MYYTTEGLSSVMWWLPVVSHENEAKVDWFSPTTYFTTLQIYRLLVYWQVFLNCVVTLHNRVNVSMDNNIYYRPVSGCRQSTGGFQLPHCKINDMCSGFHKSHPLEYCTRSVKKMKVNFHFFRKTLIYSWISMLSPSK